MSDRSESGVVRVGVVGAGWVSTMRHIPAFKADKRAVISGIFDHNQTRAEETAGKFKIPRAFIRLEDFLEGPVDVVSVCTPPQTHGPIVRASLLAGKHVLVEKPMTLTSDEGKELADMASEKSLLLCPAHSFLFSRSTQKADSFIQKGETGEIKWAMGIQLSSWRRRLPNWFEHLPGGLFFDEAPHLLYLMEHFLGDVGIEHAWRDYDNKGQEEPSERMEVRLRGARGKGYISVWSGAPFSEWMFVLFCTRSVLVLDLFRDILICLPQEKAHNISDVLNLSFSMTRQLWSGIGATGLRFARKRLFFGHDLLVRRFLDAVANGEESPVPADSGWKVITQIEEILERSSGTPD